MNVFVFTKNSKKVFDRLSKGLRDRIILKLSELKTNENIFSILKKLNNFNSATHRLRVGDYRLILKLEKCEKPDTVFLVLNIGHRRSVYS